MMNLFENLQKLNEAINDNYLYHGTLLSYAVNILKDNKLKTSNAELKQAKEFGIDHSTGKSSICFTRNKREAYNQIVFTFNSKKLKQKYKLYPVDATLDKNRSLSEERLDNRDINNVAQYIVFVELSDYAIYRKILSTKIIKNNKEKQQIIELVNLCKNYDIGIGDKLLTLYNKAIELTEELHDSFTIDPNYYEVFKNPTDKEIADCIETDPYNAIRGIIYDDDNIYCWPGNYLHHQINDKIDKKINVDKGFRFGYSDFDGWHFNSFNLYTMEEIFNYIIKYKRILQKFGNLDNRIEIYWCSGRRDDNDYAKRFDSFSAFITYMYKQGKISIEDGKLLLKN